MVSRNSLSGMVVLQMHQELQSCQALFSEVYNTALPSDSTDRQPAGPLYRKDHGHTWF